MNHICEASSTQLDEVVEFMRENWQEGSELPITKPEAKERTYWEAVHHDGRIFLYRGEDKAIGGLLALFQKDTMVTIDLLFVKPRFRDQGIEMTMLSFAERVAVKWSGDHINLIFSNKEELEHVLPKFQGLGYSYQCPINQKGKVLLEKKLNRAQFL